MKTSISLALLVLLCACKKDIPTSPPPSVVRTFEPAIAEIPELLANFHQLKERFHSGLRSDLGERPLEEAIWISEADANYEKADPSAGESEFPEGAISYALETYQKEDGSWWISNEELIAKQEDLLSELDVELNGVPAYLIDVEAVGATEGEMQLAASWKSMVAIPMDMILPSYTGCWPALGPEDYLDDAADVMNVKLHFMHLYPFGTYFVSVASTIMTVNSIVDADDNGYPIYAGTSESLGGPAWLHSGLNLPDQICFPEYWDKYLEMKAWVAQPAPGHEIIRELYGAGYDVVAGGPMDYGSPYYPMGAYHHGWRRWIGIPMTRR